MPSVFFVVPAHGRAQLADVCLANLATVCATLGASAVVIACDENADIAARLGFRVIRRDNEFLGRRFNDGFEYASKHADYVMPVGSDDLITPAYVRAMIAVHDGSEGTIGCSRLMATLNPAGTELARLRVPYDGGAGPRLFPSSLLARVGRRPADDDRQRAIDSSIQRNLQQARATRFVYADTGPLDLVDVKTDGENLNTYEMLMPYATSRHSDPWEQLAQTYPAATLDALRAVVAG